MPLTPEEAAYHKSIFEEECKTQPYKRVVIESPYAGDTERNEAYARACMKHSLNQGEAPIASHLLYTQPGVLDEEVPEQRQWGIEAGYAWMVEAELVIFYVDVGFSHGMLQAMHFAIEHKISIEVRQILLPE